MELNEYQRLAAATAKYNTDIFAVIEHENDNVTWEAEVPLPFIYPVLALAEETGEVAGKVAKFIRKNGDDLVGLREIVLPELGDVLWQLSEAARQFDLTLEEVAQYNLDKLQGRAARGTIVGEGDDR